MGRAENSVDRSVPSRAELADLLRAERDRAAITYAELAARAGVSAATLKRAASGTVIPSVDTIRRYLRACDSNPTFWLKAEKLRQKARRDEHGGRIRLLASTVSAPHTLADALSAIHINHGAPAYRDMQRRAGGAHLLPLSSISRILNRQMLPVDEQQMTAFLAGCGMYDSEHPAWLEAWTRSTGQLRRSPDISDDPFLRKWVEILQVKEAEQRFGGPGHLPATANVAGQLTEFIRFLAA